MSTDPRSFQPNKLVELARDTRGLTSYTPVLAGGGSQDDGDSVLTGKYVLHGDLMWVHAQIVLAGSFTIGTSPTLSLPSGFELAHEGIVSGYYIDDSVSSTLKLHLLRGVGAANATALGLHVASSGAVVSATVPITFAAADTIAIQGMIAVRRTVDL